MRKLSFILIALALFAPMLSFGQYFQRLHDVDSSGDFGCNIFVQQDNSYLIFNSALSSTTNKNYCSWLTVDPTGITLSNKKQIISNAFSYYYEVSGEVKKLQDGGLVAPLSITVNGNRSATGLMRLNSQYDTVFVKFYTDTSQFTEASYSCAVLTNGGYISGGYSRSNSVVNDSALLIRTDNAGNLIWKRKYRKGNGQRAYIVSLETIDNNRILAGAMSSYTVSIGNDFYTHNTPWFMILDTLGNIIKDTAYFGGPYAGGGRIYKDFYGGYFHVGSYDSCYTSDPTDKVNFPEYIAHLNDNFDIDWIHNFGTYDGHKAIWNTEQLPDGCFQLCGNNSDDQTWAKGWAAKVDHNGWTIWDNTYLCDEDWDSYLVDFDVRQDGSLVLVGAARNDTVPQWRGQELWLVSVDANGCLQPGCAPTIVKEEMVEKQAELLVYPNPTYGNFIVNCDAGSLSIMSIDGRTLKQYELGDGKTTLVLPPELAAGIYMLKYVAAGDNASSLTRLVYQP